MSTDLSQEAVLPDPFNSLLCLIAATILADRRAGAPAGKTFITQIRTQGLLKEIGFEISDVRLFAWYQLNRDIIRANLQGPRFHQWFKNTLNQLSNLSDKDAILDVMRASSRNSIKHANGRALITLTEHYWRNHR